MCPSEKAWACEGLQDAERLVARAQVYKGRLKDGSPVAVKVQRPHVVETVSVDLFIIRCGLPVQTCLTCMIALLPAEQLAVAALASASAWELQPGGRAHVMLHESSTPSGGAAGRMEAYKSGSSPVLVQQRWDLPVVVSLRVCWSMLMSWRCPAERAVGSSERKQSYIKPNHPFCICRSIGMFMRRFPRVLERVDVVALLDEWAARFFEELDYVREGNNATRFAASMARDLPQVGFSILVRYCSPFKCDMI